MKFKIILTFLLVFALAQACKKDEMKEMALNPDTAGDVMVDRFSSDAAHLFVRNSENNFPGPNEPVDFDNIPAFITKGLGPNGQMITYYNFDVQSKSPADIWVLFKEGSSTPVDGQLNIVNVIPGDPGYNDFWLVNKVTVPSDYVPNTVTSYDQIVSKGYSIEPTTMVVNCPIVPKGSTATKRFSSSEDSGLARGWYKNQVVYYFTFSEASIMTSDGLVPTSDIYVSFNINPDQPMGGPPSGFKTEDGTATGQTHNVAETVPGDTGYSPLWDVNIYDNAEFDMIGNLSNANSATILAPDAAIVNCPVVSVQ